MEKIKGLTTFLYQKFGNFIIYCIIGCSGALLDFILYSILVKFFSIHYLIANVFSVTIGITNNFFLNAHFNFKVSDKLFKRFISFFSIGIFGMLISELLLYVLIEKYQNDELISKIITIFVITIIQFTLNKMITFKKTKEIN